MKVYYPIPQPDKYKLMGKKILKDKQTIDRVSRERIAIICLNGIEIYICTSHPNFVLVKAEETTRLIAEEQSKAKDPELETEAPEVITKETISDKARSRAIR